MRISWRDDNDTMYSESVYTIHVCIQDSQIGGTPLIFFGDLYHNGALSSCLFDRMTYMVYMYIHTYVVLLLPPLLPCKLHHDPWIASSGYGAVCSCYKTSLLNLATYRQWNEIREESNCRSQICLLLPCANLVKGKCLLITFYTSLDHQWAHRWLGRR